MTAVAPQVMNPKAFKDATTPKNPFQRYRGRTLSRIDRRLDDWHPGPGDRQASVDGLFGIVAACRRWMEKRGDKDAFRHAGVSLLATQAFARLQYELFELRKGRDSYTGSLQPMQGGYIHERTTYEASGKQTATSGSTASALVKNAPSIQGLDLQGKTFNTLTQQEFDALVKTHAPKMAFPTEVVFLKKQDRIGRLIVIEDGILWDGPDTKFDSGAPDRGGYPYVIDEYGNLYSTDHHEFEFGLGNHQRFNHSSFNAGKSVISAGILQCYQGRLFYIDNNSGHYKPDRIQLLNALRMLDECGVELENIRVGLKEAASSNPGKLAFKYYVNGKVFVGNPAMRPNEEVLDS